MAVSAVARKSLTDLSRRRARTFFSVATLAIAVASVSFFAIPTLIDREMQDEVRAGRLADVTLFLRPVPLTDEQLAGLAALPNVAGVEPRSSADTRVLVGARRARARLIGVRDFARQNVDVVRVESGALPGAGEVLADVQDANVGIYAGDAGDVLTVVSGPGQEQNVRVSGRGRSLPGGEFVQDEDVIVLYATEETVSALSGEAGYRELALRLRDPSPAGAERTVAGARRSLQDVPGFKGFSNLPGARAPGDWPGKAELEAFGDFLSVITLLALLSALVLVSNTMSTLVAEQTGEIGIMRAVGARRRQIAAVYLRTALLLGLFGAAAGILVGIVLSSVLAGYFGQTFWAIDVGLGVDPAVLVLSLLVGLFVPPLAALPAIRRGIRVNLREALESTGSAVGTQDAADRFLRRARFLPRTMQIGLRGVGRRRRRSLATALIVALAVANLLAVMGVAAGATESSRAGWSSHDEDLRIWTSGARLFDERAHKAIRTTPGVAEAQPALVNEVDLAGREAFVWGVPLAPLLDYRLSAGRWFSAAEEESRAHVVVMERNLAEIAGVDVGDRITVATAAGPTQLRVIGLAANQQEDGTVLYVPLTTVRAVLDRPADASTYWIRTTSPDHSLVDRTTTLLEDRLTARGYEVADEVTYVMERDEIAENRSLTTTMGLLGLVIIAMSMVGLANAITMSVLERTREIGVLRSIGARARDIRRIFTTEGVTLALGGWLLGIPLGYALTRGLVWLLWEVADVRIPVVFPAGNLLIALGGTVVLALVILLLPVRRAVCFRPGEALRYA